MMILLLFLFIKISIQQTQIYSFFTDNSFVSSNDWIVNGASNIFTICGTERIFGGYNVFGKKAQAMILLQLPPHYSISISVDFWKIDSWNSEEFFLYVDQQLAHVQTFGSQGTQTCGSSSDDLKTTLTMNIIHNYPTAFILLTSNLDSNPDNESWGFRNFILSVFECPAGCIVCEQGDNRLQCIFWILYESNLDETTMNSFQLEGWFINDQYQVATNCFFVPLLGGYTYTGENSFMQKIVTLPSHTQVKVQFRYVFLDTWNNEWAFLYLDDIQVWSNRYDYNLRKIQDLCGDIYDEIFYVDEVIITHSKPTLSIKFTSDLDQNAINESFGVRDVYIYIPCLFGGSFDQTCGAICGNGIVEEFEVCDDQNLLPYDGCFSCQFSCVEGCSECLNGICLNCYDEWDYYIENFICLPKMKDGKIILQEECDDLIQYQFCFNGKFACPQYCKTCEYGICFECQSNYYLQDNICQNTCQGLTIIHEKQCYDSNLEPFDSCHQCQFENIEGCLTTNKGMCIFCDVGWILDFKVGKCYPKCGDYKINGSEECDIDIYKLAKKNYGCNKCQYKCQEQCLDCQFGKCYECSDGWIVNKFKCEPIFGDLSLMGFEECDDSNKLRLNGCYKCKNDCQTQCTECVKGQCFSCIYGWFLNDQFQCEKQCGDNLQALISSEQCDDNFGQDCFQCKIKCCDYCSVCMFGICLDCIYTFTLIDETCIPICGDGLVSIGFEQCDDMNLMPYDGCYECNYQCRKFCKICIKGICYDQCEYGYYEIENYQCETRCGDDIIAGDEECEKSNNSRFNICEDCQYTCPENCSICSEGICKICDKGYELNRYLNSCLSFCGNGILSNIEDCDDENKEDGDGCSKNCKVEVNYICKNFQYSFSQCTYEKYPTFLVNFIKQDFEKQYVSLKFSQQVKLLEKNNFFSDQIMIKIVELNSSEYTINMNIIQDVLDYVTNVEYQLEIIINQTLLDPPHLEVILPEILFNINDAPLINLQQTITLRIPKYMNDQKKQSSEKLQKMNSFMINSVGGLGVVFLLFGNSVLFQSLLEILQQQSYLRFINIKYPLNLFIYFESSNQITLQPILNTFKFKYVTQNLVDECYVESYEKFLFYEINSDLYSNIQAQVVLILILFFWYFACILFLTLFIKFKQHRFLWVGDNCFKYLWKISKISFQFKKVFEKQGLRTFCVANSWDILFISFLQLKANQKNNIRYQVSITAALTLSCLFILWIFSYLNQHPWFKRKIKSQILYEKLQFSTLSKKLLFIAILILFQKNEQIQSLLLSVICNFYLFALFKYDTNTNRQESFNFKLNEISISFFSLTTAFYWNILQQFFDYDQQIILGWFHISIFLTVLFVNLIFQLMKIVVEVKEKYLQFQQKKQPQINEQHFGLIPIQNIMDFKF